MDAAELSQALGYDFVMAFDTTRCVEIALEASSIENEAMEMDRQGPPNGAAAAAAYRRAAERLLEAAAECPKDHPDRVVLEEHSREVTMRADYLEGLQGDAALVPLEEHIRAVTLSMGATAAAAALEARHAQGGAHGRALCVAVDQNGDRKVMGAAAAIAGGTGLMLMGPMSAVALGVGAAYASTREDTTGSAVRKVGKVGVKAVYRARALDEEYRISTHAIAVGQSALDQVVLVGSRYGIADHAKKTTRAITTFNEKHKVTRTLGWGLSSTASALTGLMAKAGR